MGDEVIYVERLQCLPPVVLLEARAGIKILPLLRATTSPVT